jgi:hypothetical protein
MKTARADRDHATIRELEGRCANQAILLMRIGNLCRQWPHNPELAVHIQEMISGATAPDQEASE